MATAVRAPIALLTAPVLEYAAAKRRQTDGWFAYFRCGGWCWAASERQLARQFGQTYRLVRNDQLKVPEIEDIIPEEEF